jgi:cytoskeleton protein RodZ
MVLRIVSSEITWIKLRRDDQEPYEVLLKPGESMELNAKKKFHLRIGNAGGVDLFLDGKPLGKPGKQREVVELSLPE